MKLYWMSNAEIDELPDRMKEVIKRDGKPIIDESFLTPSLRLTIDRSERRCSKRWSQPISRCRKAMESGQYRDAIRVVPATGGGNDFTLSLTSSAGYLLL